MFKSILPSKRTAAVENTSNGAALTSNKVEGKENRPANPAARSPTDEQVLIKPILLSSDTDSERKSTIGSGRKVVISESRVDSGATNRAFERMLDELQIPFSLRPRLETLESPVKAAMLKSSHVLGINSTPSPPHTPKNLRRTRSIDTISSIHREQQNPSSLLDYDFPRPPSTPSRPTSEVMVLGSPFAMIEATPSYHARGVSLDIPRFSSAKGAGLIKHEPLLLKSNREKRLKVKDREKEKATKEKEKEKTKEKEKEKGKEKPKEKEKEKEKVSAIASEKDKWSKDSDISPARLCAMLAESKSTQLEVAKIKKLRLLLRNESASWSEMFLRQGGYSALLARLNEILEVEWREEQHDDQILHELLRCMKALSTSSIGCFALRSSCPTPFVQLVSLLYSDKKPGDLCSRQLIVDLLLILFELYPSPPSEKILDKIKVDGGSVFDSGARPRHPSGPRSRPNSAYISPSPSSPSPSPSFTLPSPHTSFYSLIRAILLTPPPAPTECPSNPISPHAFIASLHLPRIYKTYLQELSDVCRDYFWVFCHPENAIWNLRETDEEKVEKPRAPGGMTGGVEYEAMGYLTVHLKLINALCKCAADLGRPAQDELSAHRLHSDLFTSGLDRILTVIRKASVTYYPTLHLEIARYVSLAGGARYELPWAVARLINSPPQAVQKSPPYSASPRKAMQVPSNRPGHVAAPSLPPSRRMEPIEL